MNNVTVLGIDLAKDVFQLHGVNEYGKKFLGKKSADLSYLSLLHKCLRVKLFFIDDKLLII